MRGYVQFLMVATLLLAGVMHDALALVSDNNILMPEVGRDWKTLETPHFRIHHEAAQKASAQYLATIAEHVHGRLSPWLDWQPVAKTEVVMLDTVDLSNGSASPFPYNHMSIYLTPPVDGELMDQMPWLEMVFTHEYVHILHLDMAAGGPGIVRNIFGRSTNLLFLMDFPQVFAPTWVTEGLAVYGESEHAGKSGNAAGYGRLNSAFYDAMMRMEVARGLRSLTEVSFNAAYRWPYGQQYLYGAYFFKFVEEHYGREAVRDYIRVYGRNLLPFRMDNRSWKVFNKSAQDTWSEYQDYLTQRFAPQLAAIGQQNHVRAHTVYDDPYSNTALSAAANGDLYFLHDDASSSPQVRRLRADGSNEAVLDGRWVQDIDWHETGGLLLRKFSVCDNTNEYADLYQWQPGMSSARRLTHCGRYLFAAWRPDGKAIAAIQAERGLNRLVLLDETGKQAEVLAEMAMGDTLGQLAWSPDGATLVASIQRKKTGWNLELLDIKSRQWQAVTSDSELEQRPQFSADGKEIYFLSDHGKVWNLRRLRLGSNTIDTISNTASAITDAVVMPDKSYRMVEYTPNGKAIVALQATDKPAGERYQTLPPSLPSLDAISNAPDFTPYAYDGVMDYSPWSTLQPHSWFPLLDSSAAQASYAGVVLSGSDALDFHRWSAVPVYYYNLKTSGGVADYSFYNKITLSAQRQFFMLGQVDAPVRYLEEEVRYQALLHHSFNTMDSSLTLAAGLASEHINTTVTTGTGVDQSFRNTLSGAIVQFDNSKLYRNSISPVDGRRVQLLGENYSPPGSSDFSGKTTRMDWNEFIALGNNRALHVRLLLGEGDAGIRPYRLGGVSETLSLIGGDTGLGRRDFPLRGFPAGLPALSGSNIGLATVEWKFPLGYHYDGWFVPPVGAGRESLSVFVDSGDAWNQGEAISLKTGAGIEWNVEVLLGYDLLHLSTTVGFARGLDNDGENRLYLRVALPLL